MLAFDEAADPHTVEEEEENYFVSMTDMMVGILFIFIIMLMVFALQFQQQTDKGQEQFKSVNKKVEDVAKNLENLRSQVETEIENLSKPQRVRNALLADLKEELNRAGLEVQIDEENGVLRLTENAIRFASDKSTLDAVASSNVLKLSAVLATVLPRYTNCVSEGETVKCKEMGSGAAIDTVFIEGHTDTSGNDDRNWALSTERAVSTYRAIVTNQITLRQLKNRSKKEILSVSGYSSTRPIPGTEGDGTAKTQSSNDFARNRRIDMRFVMEVDKSEGLNNVLKLTKDMKKQIDKLSEKDPN